MKFWRNATVSLLLGVVTIVSMGAIAATSLNSVVQGNRQVRETW